MTKALIITYYWPPAGGPGVQRWLNFVNYFEEFGVKALVFIPENATYPIIDKNLSLEVHSNIEIIKFPINEPYKLAKLFSKKKTKTISSGIVPKKNISLKEKLLLYIRGNFFIPDARIGWVKPSVEFLSDYISKNNIDVVITTGPPHSLHLIGLELKEKLNCKWLADFRDPWTTIHYHMDLRLSKSSAEKHKKLESKVLNNADLITVTSPSTKKEFQQLTNKRIEVVTNGYQILQDKSGILDTKFTIVHIGSLLSGRNPEVLWSALSEMSHSDKEFSEDLRIKLIGATSVAVTESIESFGLDMQTESINYIAHNEALRIQKQSQILLLIESNTAETRAIIPGKLFEYLAAQRPILAFGPSKSDIEMILTETKSGKFFEYHEKENLKTQILKWYEDFKNKSLEINSINIEQYSRKALSITMSNLVKNLNTAE